MQWRRNLLVLLLTLTTVSWSAVNLASSGKTPKTAITPTVHTSKTVSHTQSNDMWSIIASNFYLPHGADTPSVQKQIQWFQTHQKYFEKIANQGQPYMYYIYQSVKKRGLPGELVLLPMIESAYDPFAYSWVGAAGLWQMMPATGSNFGLKQDWWYDGRKDIISSTDAALDYLTYLETFFNGNWPLAIAAYNSGEGTVQNAIDRNAKRGLGTSFGALNLPAETESYVPRLMALAAIVSNPGKYGVVLPPIKTGPYFGVVSLKKQIDLSQAAKMAGIKLAVLYELNPGYNRWATDPKGPYRLLLPLDAIARFEAVYAEQFGAHSIISSSHETTSAVLVDSNSHATSVRPTEEAIVTKPLPTATTTTITHTPTPTVTAPTPSDNPAPKVKSTTTQSSEKPVVLAKATTVSYKVKRGDNLWSIAKHFNVTIEQLRTWNKLSKKGNVHVGQILNIEKIE